MDVSSFIQRIDSPELEGLCGQLSELAPALEKPGAWPAEQLNLCGRRGVFRWFVDVEYGGAGWSAADCLRGYMSLARACLTTTFVITQEMGAVRRIASSNVAALRERWLPLLMAGDAFATVGISHLTTSRRHLGTPALCAEERRGEYVLRGFCPWVTGAEHADVVVVGAEFEDGRELLACVPTRQAGVRTSEGFPLLALTASCTGKIEFDDVVLSPEMILAGPSERVLSQGRAANGSGAGTGGLQTSALALGLASAAIGFLQEEAAHRPSLTKVSDGLLSDWRELETALVSAAGGGSSLTSEQIRGASNRLVIRATQAAMMSAKGAGFVQGHPAGRWCREALFFLVWSCPEPVAQSHLCDLAGIPTTCHPLSN